MFQLDDIDMEAVPETTPEGGFHYAWLSELLEQVLSDVEQEYISTGKETHWKVFSARLLDPITSNSKPLSLTDICKEYDIETESKASNMIGTVKRRLRNALERCLKRFVLRLITLLLDLLIEQEHRPVKRRFHRGLKY